MTTSGQLSEDFRKAGCASRWPNNSAKALKVFPLAYLTDLKQLIANINTCKCHVPVIKVGNNTRGFGDRLVQNGVLHTKIQQSHFCTLLKPYDFRHLKDI